VRHDLTRPVEILRLCDQNSTGQRENPVRNVYIPSDADAIRMHILTTEEENQSFSRAAKHHDLHDVGRLILNQAVRPDEVVCLRNNVSVSRTVTDFSLAARNATSIVNAGQPGQYELLTRLDLLSLIQFPSPVPACLEPLHAHSPRLQ